MATVSDNKYAYYNQADSVLGWHPALRAAYDYYPFGMLMPGRYVSDTSQNCVTVTQPKWAWEWIAVKCWTVNSWQWPYYKPIHDGFAEGAGDAVQVTALNPGDGVSFQMSVTANEKQELNVDVQRIAMSKGATVQVLEQENGRWVSLAEASLDKPDNISLIFTPTQSNVQIQVTGPVQTLITKLCLYAYQEVEKDELVTICSEDKDKYYWGYDGVEKTNEWSGIGNSYQFKFRTYSPRLGRFLSVDPLAAEYAFQSPYSFAGNSPILYMDLEGAERFNPMGYTQDQLQQAAYEAEWKQFGSVGQHVPTIGQHVPIIRKTNSSDVINQTKKTSTNNFPNVDLSSKTGFVSQWSLSNPKVACNRASREIIKQTNGNSISKANRIITGYAKSDGGIAPTKNAKVGVDYIKNQLSGGNVVMVGVNYKAGGQSDGQPTDHYIVIVGMGYDKKKNENYFRFYQVGNHKAKDGANPNNKLYVKDNNLIKGSPAGSTTPYTVTDVRKNGK